MVLGHQVAVLERQLGGKKVRFAPADGALLAAVLHRLRPQALRRMRLLVRLDTVLRWHRDLVRRRHAARSRPRRPGRPAPCPLSAPWSCAWFGRIPGWGYRRVHGELLVLGLKVAPSTVWEILKEAGIGPRPAGRPRPGPLPALPGRALLACDFFETVTLSGTRVYVLAVIEHHARRIRVLGVTAHPNASWVA